MPWRAGAHTIGRAHCTAFSDRLYNFSATGVADPTLDPPFLAQLQHACPASSSSGGGGVDPELVVPMEPHTPHALDTLYYQALLASAPTAAAQARQSAYGGYPLKLKFAAAMVKMGQIQVLTGGGGARPGQGQVQRRQLKNRLASLRSTDMILRRADCRTCSAICCSCLWPWKIKRIVPCLLMCLCGGNKTC
jgi:hypothetical protein